MSALTTWLTAIADAIRGKDGTEDPIDHADFPAKITAIPQLDTSGATAVESDLLLGKTAYVDGEKLTGTLTTADLTWDATATEEHIVYSKSAYGAAGTKQDGTAQAMVITETKGVYPDTVFKMIYYGQTIYYRQFFQSGGAGNPVAELLIPNVVTILGSGIRSNTMAAISGPNVTTLTAYSIYDNQSMTTLTLPKCTNYGFERCIGYCLNATSYILGSIGYPVTIINNDALKGSGTTSKALVVTIYVTPGTQPLAKSPWEADATTTIVYRSAVDGSVL